jgi:hypothetical protein
MFCPEAYRPRPPPPPAGRAPPLGIGPPPPLGRAIAPPPAEAPGPENPPPGLPPPREKPPLRLTIAAEAAREEIAFALGDIGRTDMEFRRGARITFPAPETGRPTFLLFTETGLPVIRDVAAPPLPYQYPVPGA